VTPIAYYSFTSSNKLSDGTGNGHNLSPFKTQSMNYPLNYDPSNDALVFFGQDVVATSSQSINLGNSFSVSIVFSISSFYLTSTLVQFTPNDMSSVSPLNILVLYIFFSSLFIYLFYFILFYFVYFFNLFL